MSSGVGLELPAHGCDRQNGYVGIAFVTMVALVMLVVMPGLTIENDSRTRALLAEARHALLSYAVTYPMLYEPAGAGPGHFPCPDTDMPMHLGGAVNQGPFAGVGPNPPCGAAVSAVGLLPRHVRIDNQRYAFHRMRDQSIGYVVSTAFVNNPSGAIHASTPGDLSLDKSDDLIALLVAAPPDELPSLQLTPNGPPVALLPLNTGLDQNSWWRPDNPRQLYATITASDLRMAMVAYVGDWSIRQLHRLRCADGLGVVCAEQAPDESVPLNNRYRLFDVLWDAQAENAVRPEHVQLDGIDAQRHWFVTNGWFETVFVDVADECKQDNAMCQWHFETPVIESTDILLRLIINTERVAGEA